MAITVITLLDMMSHGRRDHAWFRSFVRSFTVRLRCHSPPACYPAYFTHSPDSPGEPRRVIGEIANKQVRVVLPVDRDRDRPSGLTVVLYGLA